MTTKQELDEFKNLVVKVAMRDAIRNHWCRAVVRSLVEMGLGDRIGPIFIFQQRRQDRGRWSQYDCFYTLAAANRQMNNIKRHSGAVFEYRIVTVNPFNWKVIQVLDHYKPTQEMR